MNGGGAAIVIWILVFFGIFYFLAIRPQRRQKQAHAEMERMLKKGDEVVTVGGLFGTVSRISDDWVELEIAKRTKVKFMKRSIASITSIAEDDEEDDYIEVEDEDLEEYETLEDVEEIEEPVEYVDDEDDSAPQGPPAPEPPKV
jgi:preprotein translocase subunit YajC